MPKTESSKIWGHSGAFAKQVKSAWRRHGIGLTFVDHPCTRIIRKKRKAKTEATPRQRLWRDKWGQIGKAFDEMPKCQRDLFWEYYLEKRHTWLGHQKDERTAGREHLSKTCKYVSLKALWHRITTQGLLSEFITRFLKARLIIASIERPEECVVVVNVAMVSQQDKMAEEGLREIKVIRPRQ